MEESINDQARRAVVRMMKKEKSSRYLSEYYGIPRTVISEYLYTDNNVGSVYARKVLRVEMARKQAEKSPVMCQLFFPSEKDRYKGTRNL